MSVAMPADRRFIVPFLDHSLICGGSGAPKGSGRGVLVRVARASAASAVGGIHSSSIGGGPRGRACPRRSGGLGLHLLVPPRRVCIVGEWGVYADGGPRGVLEGAPAVSPTVHGA